MTIHTRPATTADLAHLIGIRLMAHGGCNEALYGDLEQSMEELITDELLDQQSTNHYENHHLALIDDEVVGGLHAYPWDDLEHDSRNPHVPEERFAIEAPFAALAAPGTYYIHALSVYGSATRKGVGSALLEFATSLAFEREIDELSLFVFAQNAGAVSLYRKHGYRVIGRRPVFPHPKIIYTGDVLLMTRRTI